VIPDFQKLLDAHDWDFMSSEGTRYNRGLASQKKLLYLCQQQPELFRLYNRAESRHIAGLSTTTNKFQTSSGNSAENENQKPTNPQTHSIPTTMKDVFQLFFDICIKPLVEAINNHSVGAPASPQAAATTTQVELPPAEKPAKPAKAPKPAPAPAPEPEVEAEPDEPMTEGRFKETVKTLSNEGKMSLKAYFVKKFGHNTMAEVLPQNRADIHAKALELGATDTDPDAIGDM
jgi:predicted component of type VI protein secretion system